MLRIRFRVKIKIQNIKKKKLRNNLEAISVIKKL